MKQVGNGDGNGSFFNERRNVMRKMASVRRKMLVALVCVGLFGVTGLQAAIVTVDNFNDGTVDTNLWDTTGNVSEVGGRLYVGASSPAASAELKASMGIPLPQDGWVLTVDTTQSGSGAEGTMYVAMSNGDGTCNSMIRTDTSDQYGVTHYDGDGYTWTGVSVYTPTTTDVFRWVYDNTAGDKKLSIYVKKDGAADFTQLGSTYTGAWSDTSAKLQAKYYVHPNVTRYTYSDYLQYELVPEPATLGLLGIGGLLALCRRKR